MRFCLEYKLQDTGWEICRMSDTLDEMLAILREELESFLAASTMYRILDQNKVVWPLRLKKGDTVRKIDSDTDTDTDMQHTVTGVHKDSEVSFLNTPVFKYPMADFFLVSRARAKVRKVKKGDWVVCVSATGYRGIQKGGKYRVEIVSIGKTYIQIGERERWYPLSLFKLVTAKKKAKAVPKKVREVETDERAPWTFKVN